jgi:hypothetical protein
LDNVRDMISKGRKGAMSEAGRERLVASKLGKPMSEQARANMSRAAKLRYAKQRAAESNQENAK